MPDLPPFAHIPGRNARHPEDWFDEIKASVTDEVPISDLHHTDAFCAGLAYLKAGYFWECHEVLEAVWMRCPDGSVEREMVQALIQFANARLKHLMGKPRAVLRLCDRVEAHLANCADVPVVLGVSVPWVAAEIAQVRANVD